jgi:hypothetical protein
VVALPEISVLQAPTKKMAASTSEPCTAALRVRIGADDFSIAFLH